ncbi:hypothetical protein [Pseudomonas syringae group genomosp. 3]|uniref:hypothetical protein n=1 Tax=Pseudomonas syringae group genomosp. 3 TaxID=251701 RepID=UPI0011C3EBE3|nr:hypothetical protein [Pseudomonas syringae group genomosp. 3]
MNNLRQVVNQAWLEERGLYSKREFEDGLWLYTFFTLVGMVLIFAARFVPQGRYQSYFEAAANQGLGPTLWDAVGLPGILLLGLTIVCPALVNVGRASKALLEGAFGIGAAMTGIILGGFVIQAPEIYTSKGIGSLLFWGTVGIVGLSCIATLNLCTWCLAKLPHANPRFSIWLAKLTAAQRVILGLSLIFVGITSFVTRA